MRCLRLTRRAETEVSLVQPLAVGQFLAAALQFDQPAPKHVNAIGDVDGALGAFLDDQKRNTAFLSKSRRIS